MFAVVATIAAALLAEAESTPAAERPVWVFTLKDQETPLYGYMDESEGDKSLIKVVPDIPWEAEPKPVYLSRAKLAKEPEREWPKGRENRLAEQARAAGYRRVGERFYPVTEIEWANKSREMAGLGPWPPAPPSPAPPERPSAEAPAAPLPEPPPAPLAQQWGWHAAVVVAGLALLALVAKTMLFRAG